MESLHMRGGFSLPRQEFSFSRQSFVIHLQPFRNRQCMRKLQEGYRIGADRVLVRARRGDGGEEDATASGAGRYSFASPSLEVSEEEDSVGGKRRPFWQRAWGYGGRRLGFGETWEEDLRGQRELEELDLFLEGRGLDFQWKDVLEPSVENVLALVLTGLFLYAVALIGWQLLLVAAAITLSALKYAVIASIVVGVLIFFIS